MCTRPKPAHMKVDPKTRKNLGQSLIFHMPEGITHPHYKANYEKLGLPCGHCPECLKGRALEWAIRNYCELHQSPGPDWFITFTYDEEHLPADGSLDFKHMTDFIKRLRKWYSLRYYYAGEYGTDTFRPHFHACLYGLDLDQSDFQVWATEDGQQTWVSEKLNKIWGHGRVVIGHLNMASIQYVTKYITKRVYGAESNDHYRRFDENNKVYHLTPENNRMSRKPALGTKFFEIYGKQYDCPELDWFVMEGGFKAPVPKHFTRMMKETNPEAVELIKESRVKNARVRTDKELAYKDNFDIIMEKKQARNKI